MVRRKLAPTTTVEAPSDFESQFPPSGKLRPIKQYSGTKLLSDTSGKLIVEFDKGSFRFMFEQLQNAVRRVYADQSPTFTPATSGAVRDAAERALVAVRLAAEAAGITRGQVPEAEPDTAAAVKRRRGRPAKEAAVAVPARRGRPPKAATPSVPATAPTAPVKATTATRASKVLIAGVSRQAKVPAKASRKAAAPAKGRRPVVVPSRPLKRSAKATRAAGGIVPGRSAGQKGNTHSTVQAPCQHPARKGDICPVCAFNARKAGK